MKRNFPFSIRTNFSIFDKVEEPQPQNHKMFGGAGVKKSNFSGEAGVKEKFLKVEPESKQKIFLL